MKFTIGIFGRETFPHTACFEDYAKALAAALRELGHEVTGFDSPGRIIMFGVNNIVDVNDKMPKDAIIFNTEQVGSATGVEGQMANFRQFKNFTMWDYSQVNAVALREAGLERVVHCPIGYIPSMTVIDPVENEDIDVLFYGSVNPKRREILDALDAADLKVVRLFGVYGAPRDEAIARAKIVLNLHFYDKPIFEIFRVSHLLANRKCVVSEDGGCDPELEAFAARATELVPREQIVSACLDLVESSDERRAMAELSFQEFRHLNLVDNVRRALEQS